jgi:hypothetical protein
MGECPRLETQETEEETPSRYYPQAQSDVELRIISALRRTLAEF